MLTGGNAGAGGYTLDVQGRRTNCTDGSGKPFTGASLNGGEAGPWSVNGTLTFTNVAGSEYQITRASYGAFVIVLDVTAWAHSNGGPFHLVLAFAKT